MAKLNLFNGNNYTVQLTIPNGTNSGYNVVQGFTQAEFGFSGSNSWGNIMPLSNLTKLMGINSMLNPIMVLNGSSQMSLESLWQTSDSWQGSQKPSFNVDLLFLALNSNCDPREPVRHLLRGAYPSGMIGKSDNAITSTALTVSNGITNILANLAGGVIGTVSNVFGGDKNLGTQITNQIKQGQSDSIGQVAPFGFGLVMDNGQLLPKANTTCSLKIGKWFRAMGLVIDSVNPTFSREVTPDGFPLYARCSVTLSPYRMITAQEMMDYFIELPKFNFSATQLAEKAATSVGLYKNAGRNEYFS